MSEPSIIQSMGRATWSTEDGTAYEVALEGINQVVGLFSEQIAAARAAGDTRRVEELNAQQRSWSRRRLDLTPADRATVDAVTAECSEVLLRARRSG